jgi:hypothetical protein
MEKKEGDELKRDHALDTDKDKLRQTSLVLKGCCVRGPGQPLRWNIFVPGSDDLSVENIQGDCALRIRI